MLFSPDIFSVKKPKWHSVEPDTKLLLVETLKFFPPDKAGLIDEPYQSGAFGINSNNFKLKCHDESYLLKRWPLDANVSSLNNSLHIMAWLSQQGLPVPKPVVIDGGRPLLQMKSGYWSLFPFIEGSYFSGVENELLNFIKTFAQLHKALGKLPASIYPEPGPNVLQQQDKDILKKTATLSSNWNACFGEELSDLLAEYWPLISSEYDEVSNALPKFFFSQPVHYDLHPHNLIIKDQKIAAVLDFESCNILPIGQALGFASLKQCRQTVSLQSESINPTKLGDEFKNNLIDIYPEAKEILPRLGDFAVSEVLRRICLILRLNLEKSQSIWNDVLPIQLFHLKEARQLFG